MTRIPAAMRREIVARVAAGGSYKAVAAELGVSYTAAREIALAAGVRSQVKSTSRSPWNRQFTEQWEGAR